MAKAIAFRTGQKLDINQQCLSEGAANLSGSFFQCIPGSGSLTRSTVNQQAGAVSQWSGVFAAIAVAGTVLLFAPLAQYIPRSSLAGLLILAAYRMVNRRQLVFHLRASRFDAGVVLATAAAAVFISVEFCIVVGVFLSFVLYVPRTAHVHLTPLTPSAEGGLREHRSGDGPMEGLLVFELDGELFFGAEPEVAKHFAAIEEAAHARTRAVLLVLRRGRNADATFLSLLKQFAERLQARQIILVLGGVRPELRAAFATTGLTALIGEERIFLNEPADRPFGVAAAAFAATLTKNTSRPSHPLDAN